jgi:SET domain
MLWTVRSPVFFFVFLATLLASAEPEECRVEDDSNAIWPKTEQCSREEDDVSEDPVNQENAATEHCGLYMAPSTIPGAGLGVFTAHAREVGDAIHEAGEVCVPLLDLYQHSPQFQPFMDYYWSGDNLGVFGEVNRTQELFLFCPGIDGAANCHLALNNVFRAIPDYDDGSTTMGYHRSTHPGVGAFTPYYNGVGIVRRSIPVGGEIFKDYGDDWFTWRPEVFGNIPLSMDYVAAVELLQTFVQLPYVLNILQRANAQDDLTPEQVDARRNMLTDFYETLLLSIQTTWDSRTLNALPDTFYDALVANNAGDMAAVLQRHHVHTLDFLEQHGACLDHLRPGPSTLPNAGHGAFATRDLPAGTILTKSPLLHTVHDDYMYMYEFVEYNGTKFRLPDRVRHRQLLYNYCYTHPESTMVLCPYGGGVSYINHADAERSNIHLEWATGWDEIAHNRTLVEEGTLDDLTDNARPQLAFQYVAIRDIAAGEELFLDYGDAWEEAWQEHVEQYVYDDQTTPKYASAHYWNHVMEDLFVRTIEEQEMDPYPSNLQIRCHAKLFLSHVAPYAIYHWKGENYGLACRILDRFVDATWGVLPSSRELYTVEMELANDQQLAQGEVLWIQRTDVPRSAIRFFNRPYTTDIHLDTAFRHSIGIPDELFPEQWKNL